jgi:putative membrane protein
MMGPYWGHGWNGMGWGGALLMLLFWVLLVAGVIVLLRRLRARDLGPDNEVPQKTALDILEERYARGEIDREEFEQKRRDLAR